MQTNTENNNTRFWKQIRVHTHLVFALAQKRGLKFGFRPCLLSGIRKYSSSIINWLSQSILRLKIFLISSSIWQKEQNISLSWHSSSWYSFEMTSKLIQSFLVSRFSSDLPKSFFFQGSNVISVSTDFDLSWMIQFVVFFLDLTKGTQNEFLQSFLMWSELIAERKSSKRFSFFG